MKGKFERLIKSFSLLNRIPIEDLEFKYNGEMLDPEKTPNDVY
jgi:hypothetical protein